MKNQRNSLLTVIILALMLSGCGRVAEVLFKKSLDRHSQPIVQPFVDIELIRQNLVNLRRGLEEEDIKLVMSCFSQEFSSNTLNFKEIRHDFQENLFDKYKDIRVILGDIQFSIMQEESIPIVGTINLEESTGKAKYDIEPIMRKAMSDVMEDAGKPKHDFAEGEVAYEAKVTLNFVVRAIPQIGNEILPYHRSEKQVLYFNKHRDVWKITSMKNQ